MLLKHKLKMNQVNDPNQGGTGAAPATPAATPPAQAQGSGGDPITQLYGQQPAPAAGTQQQTPQGTANQTPPAGQQSTSGYTAPPPGSTAGYADPAAPAAGQQPPTGDPAAPAATPTQIKFNKEGLKEEHAKSIEKFATDHKLGQEAVDAFAELARAANGNIEAFKADQKAKIEAAKLKQRTDWRNELNADPNFGGQQFDQSLKRVDAVLDSPHFSETKKFLTTTGGALPPSVMKDLLKMHTVLFGQTDGVVHPSGDAQNANLDQGQKFLKEFYK